MRWLDLLIVNKVYETWKQASKKALHLPVQKYSCKTFIAPKLSWTNIFGNLPLISLHCDELSDVGPRGRQADRPTPKKYMLNITIVAVCSTITRRRTKTLVISIFLSTAFCISFTRDSDAYTVTSKYARKVYPKYNEVSFQRGNQFAKALKNTELGHRSMSRLNYIL